MKVGWTRVIALYLVKGELQGLEADQWSGDGGDEVKLQDTAWHMADNQQISTERIRSEQKQWQWRERGSYMT